MSKTFPCCLCQAELQVKSTKKDKPYMVCEDCGLQVFVRFRSGIRRLNDLVRGGSATLSGYVVCRRCQVAVRRVESKVERPLFDKAGIYCPECGERLMTVSEDE